MSNSLYIRIGGVIKPHGLKGDVVLFVEPNTRHLVSDFELLFFEFAGSYVPHRIETIAPLNKGKFKVKLAGIEDSDAAEDLRNRGVFQLSELLNIENQLDLNGFQVFEVDLGEIGVVTNVNDSGVQTLMEIVKGEKEFYVPLVDEFIVEITEEDRKIVLDLPDGILDL